MLHDPTFFLTTVGGLVLFGLVVVLVFDFMCAGEAFFDTLEDWWRRLTGKRHSGGKGDAGSKDHDQNEDDA